jgi:3-oxoacyl-[acyl-carrier protein] reductase
MQQPDGRRRTQMLLEHKNAVIYGGGGAIGGAVARSFAREGAHLFLAGRTLAKVEAVAEEITAAGGMAETAQVDVLDEQAVDKHIGKVAERARRIDILFNAIGMQDVQGKPLHEMSLEDFTRPITIATTTQFLTARAVARRMIRQGSGVIMSITAGPARRACLM